PRVLRVPAGGLLGATGPLAGGGFVGLWGGGLVAARDKLGKALGVGGKGGMHPRLVFPALLGGITMFGLLGIIAGPLVIAFLLALLRMYERDFADRPTGTA